MNTLIRKHLPALALLALASVSSPLASLHAQETPPVTLLGSESAQGFEFYGNSLYWWRLPTLLDGDRACRLSTIIPSVPRRLAGDSAISGYLPAGDISSAADYIWGSTATQDSVNDSGLYGFGQSSVVRDASYFYYVRDGFLRRRLVAQGTDASESNVQKFDGFSLVDIAATGACMVRGERLWYWDGTFISSVALNGAPNQRNVELNSIIPGGGSVRKMTISGQRIIFLLSDGRLYMTNSLISGFSGQILLGSGVKDFAVRTDNFEFFGGTSQTAMIYACDATSLWQYEPIFANKTIIPTPLGGSISSIALDDTKFFIAATAAGKPVTYRKSWPRKVGLQNTASNWDLISTQTGNTNLRSDGRYLYAVFSGGIIRALPTDAAAVRLDVEARGMEVVQVIQDLNNDVPLIAGREAYVRGYAWIAENSTNLGNSLRFPAELQVLQNGTLLERIAPLNDPFLTNINNMAAWRGTTNAAYLFRVRPELMREGNLEFRFTVNPTGRIPETPGVTRTNTITDTVSCVAKKPTVLSFIRVHSTAGTFNVDSDPRTFSDCLARATSLLPVSRLVPYQQSAIIYKPVPTISYKKVLGVSIPYPTIEDRSFDMGETGALINDKDWALIWLNARQATNPGYLGSAIGNTTGLFTSDIHWCGTVPRDAGSFNGVGNRGILNGLVFRVTSEDAVSNAQRRPWDSTWGGRTLAHELGHNYGRKHINAGAADNPEGPFDPFPAPEVPSQFESTDITLPNKVVGFDTVSLTPVIPNDSAIIPPAATPKMVGDLMSYTASRWPSRQTYMAIFDSIPNSDSGLFNLRKSAAPLAVAETRLFVQLTTDAENRAATFSPSLILPPGSYPADLAEAMISQAAALTNAPLRIRQLSSTGAILHETALLKSEHADSHQELQGYLQYLPYDPAMRRLQVLNNGLVIGDLKASASAPSLSIPTVSSGGDWLQAAWTAQDADDDILTFAIQYSNDGGANWTSLSARTSELSITLERALIPGGSHCLFRVIASDGLNTTIRTSQTFGLPLIAPQVSIQGISPGERLPFGTLRILSSSIIEPEDGILPDSSLVWSLRELTRNTESTGTGPTFPVHNLAPGNYEITLTATDSDNQTGTRKVPFSVAGVSIPTAATPPVLDGLNTDAAYANSPVMRLNFGSGPFGLFYGTTVAAHHGERLYVCISDIQRAAGSSKIRIAIDANGSGGAPTAQDVAIEIDENGNLSEYRGNGTAFVQTTTPGAAVAFSFLATGSTWSVEMSLPNGVIGGWSGDAGIAVVQSNSANSASWPPGLTTQDTPAKFATIGRGTLPAVPNARPIANAGPDQLLTLTAGEAVTLDGGLSNDPNGNSSLTYRWEQLSGPTLSLLNSAPPKRVLAAPSVLASTTCSFRLSVSDGQFTSEDEVSLTFLPRAPQELSPKAAAPIRVSPSGVSGALDWPGSGQLVMLQTSTDLQLWQDIGLRLTDIRSQATFSENLPTPGGKRFFRLYDPSSIPVPNPGNAIQLFGTDGRVTVPHSPAFNSYPMTVSAYVLTTTNDAVNRGIVEKYVGGSRNGWLLFLRNGRLRGFYFSSAGNMVFRDEGDFQGMDGGLIADGFWHHCTMTVDATGGKLYVDGVLKDSMTWLGTPGPCTTTTPLKFGKYDTINSLNGQIDDVTIWNSALSQEQLAEAIRVSPPIRQPGLVSLWRFDETDGTTVESATDPSYNGQMSGNIIRTPSSAGIYR